MTLPLSEEILEACYEFLRITKPFSSWNLPNGEDINFKVGRRPTEAARYVWDPNTKKHYIIISTRGVGHTQSLMRAMAHEMIHLHLRIRGWESKKQCPSVHNAAFRKFAIRVCKYHGFDPKAFY